MPASDPSGIRQFAIAILHVIVLAMILWAGAKWLAQSKYTLSIYRYSLGSIPAYMYADHLSKTLDGSKQIILLVGPSTVREGFDDAVMNAVAPSYQFINSGVTSPGTITHTELLVDILRWYGIRVDEVVLGLNSRMLANRLSPILSTRYIDLMDYDEGLYYLNFVNLDYLGYAIDELYKNHVWPMNRLAIRIDYLARFGLYQLQNRFAWSPPKTRESFERGTDPLEHRGGFLYRELRHSPTLLSKHVESMRRRGLLEENRYAGRAQIESLRNTLLKAQEVAERVTVVIMPEHSSVVDGFAAYGDKAFNEVLGEFHAENIRVVDRRRGIPDELIRDIAHLVPEGRDVLSTDLAITLTR